METTLTESGPFERLLTVHLDEAELETAKDRAARKLSREIKVKGFRPGKAPRRIVESMVGPERVRSEALEEALPEIVGAALEEAELHPAVVPSVSDTRDTDDGLDVDVVVTLWPTIDELPGYAGRRVVVDRPSISDEEVDEQVDRMRSQFAELEDVSRPAGDGDFVLVDITARNAAGDVAEASATDLLYEVGSGSFIPGLDEPMRGASAGDIKDVATELPEGFGDSGGQPVNLRVLVKGVRTRKLPDLDDDWVEDVSEFETVDELRVALAENLTSYRRAEAASVVRDRLVEDLLGDVDLELPEQLVDAELETSAHRFVHRLESQGLDLARYLDVTGQDEESLLADMRRQAELNLRTRILLDAIAGQEEVTVEPDELSAVVAQLAAGSGESPDEYARRLAEGGQVEVLASDILRQKTLDRLVELAAPIDADGEPVDLGPPGGDEADGEDDETGEDERADGADELIVDAIIEDPETEPHKPSPTEEEA